MMEVKLDPDTEERLSRISKATGRSKSYYVNKAVKEFLEDREDYLAAVEILKKNEPRKSITEVREELGLESRTNQNS